MAFGGFFNDPFFGNAGFSSMNGLMRQQLDEMDRMMADPFGMMSGPRNPRQMMIQDDAGSSSMNRGRQADVMQAPSRVDPFAMQPFGMFGGGLFGVGGINQMFQQMQDLQQHALNDPNSHVVTHSQVFSYNNFGEQPQIYEASDSVRKAGNVKEVRKTVRDSRSGTEKMTIGHHIGDRHHVIEKVRDPTGEIRTKEDFRYVEPHQAEEFDREFAGATRQHSGRHLHDRSPHGYAAIQDRRDRRAARAEERSPQSGGSRSARGARGRTSGPIIEEIE